MRYTPEDLPTGKLYVDGVYVPKAIWFDTDTGVYERLVTDERGLIQLDYFRMEAKRERATGQRFRFEPDKGGWMEWETGKSEMRAVLPRTLVEPRWVPETWSPEPDAVVRAEK